MRQTPDMSIQVELYLDGTQCVDQSVGKQIKLDNTKRENLEANIFQ